MVESIVARIKVLSFMVVVIWLWITDIYSDWKEIVFWYWFLTNILSSLPTECAAGYYRASGGTCQPCPANSNRTSNQNETFCTCEDNRVTGSESPTTTAVACDGKLMLVCFRVDVESHPQVLPCVLMKCRDYPLPTIQFLIAYSLQSWRQNGFIFSCELHQCLPR